MSVATTTTTTGSQVKIKTVLRDEEGNPEDSSGDALSLRVFGPDGGESKFNEGEIDHPGPAGEYSKHILANVSGLWHYRWYVNNNVADEGVFYAESEWDAATGEKPEPDLTDLRVLVPAARRAMEGPYGPPLGKPALSAEQIYQALADACAQVILYSGSLFGHELLVKGRDPLVGFPTEWQTDKMLTPWESAVVVTQAALDFIFHIFRDLRTSQTIQNEGTQWSYELSPGVIKNYLETLKDARDKALDGLREHNPVLDIYASNIRVRDQATVAVLEWWDTNSPGLSGAGLPGGQEASIVPWFPGEFANP